MAVCVAASAERERFLSADPMKVEIPSWSASRPRLASMQTTSTSTGLSPVSSPRLAGADDRTRLRLLTGSSFGTQGSFPRSQLGSASIDDDMDFQNVVWRDRLRTESFVGMPYSPWYPGDGLATIWGAPPPSQMPTRVQRASESPVSAPTPKDFGAPNTPPGAASNPVFFGAPGLEPTAPRLYLSPYLCETTGVPGSPQAASQVPQQVPQQVSPGAQQRPITAETENGRLTTIMLRDLPSGLTRATLLNFLDMQGFAGRYDFAYLPVNFDTMAGLSHAFVNMVSPADAQAAHAHFEGFCEWGAALGMASDTKCHVVWNDKHQGLQSLVERYANSPVMHDSVPDECKPVIIIGGRRMQFPPPTQKVKPPKNFKTKA